MNKTQASEIDTELADNYQAQARVMSRLDAAQRTIDNPERTVQYYIDQAHQDITKYAAELAQLREDAAPGEAEYAARRWNRYFIVQNANGHVHRSMNCSTCFATTTYGWIPQLSDCDEAEMVAEYGEMACTVCFPEAPVMKGFGDGTSALAKYSVAEKAQRQSEKDERAAKKAAKTLNDEDVFGELGHGSWKVTTVAAAKKELREAAVVIAGFGYQTYAAEAPAVRESARKALSAKGVTDEEMDTIEAKAVKTATKRGY